MDLKQLKAKDAAHVLHPNTILHAHEESGGLMIARGQGATVYDVEGKAYIDGLGALWLANVGYGRDEIADAAAAQMKLLPFWSLFWSYGHPKAVELAEKLSSLAPAGMNHCFFTSGGSEANESSIKIARLYHVRNGQPDRTVIIATQKAYHGVSYGAMTATGLESVRANFAPYVSDFAHIPAPYCYRCPLAKEYPSCGLACADELEKAILAIGPERVAAFMIEPIGGVGGVIEPPVEYLQHARAICDKYGVLLIADEVICGFGRTGTWFGVEHSGVTPDLISCAKGLTSGYFPMGASIVHDRVFEVLKGQPGDYFNHGFTYSGHPVGCAVALANIAILEREDLAASATAKGAYLRKRLTEMENPYIGDIRGKGLMLGMELVSDRPTKAFPTDPDTHKKIEALCRAEGLLLRALGGFVLAVSPPLVITIEEIDRLVEIMDRNIRLVMAGT